MDVNKEGDIYEFLYYKEKPWFCKLNRRAVRPEILANVIVFLVPTAATVPAGVWLFKGTVSRDFLLLVFFYKLFLLGLVDMPRNDFNFLRLFANIFDYFGASPASTTPAKHALPVSLTPVSNSSPVSTIPVSDTFTVIESFIDVNDTGKKLLIGVIDTGKACICWCQWHRRSMSCVTDTGEAPEKSNITANIRKKSKSFLGLPTRTRRSFLKKNPEVENLVALSL